MTRLFSLTCPTCGAHLQISGEKDQFRCEHCGNKYLLDHKVSDIDESARRHLTPLVTYTQAIGQWLRVAEYDVILLRVDDRATGDGKVFHIEVEYQNKTDAPIKYRHDQWVLFDAEGHSFEPVKDFTHPHLYSEDKIYLGLTRVLNPGMKLKGWLAFVLPESSRFEYLQFSAGTPIKTVEFRVTG
jgi:DNA-directed RNA polymerase subunit RPC12/RpoP